MYFIGLDLHWKTSSIHILDSDGHTVKRETIKGGWDKLMMKLAVVPRPFAICYEASCG